ncbi:MAG TPA: alpha/beta hydrolase [Ktedonosporobacter sp.]|nr:alpha/beta hydrolase [Ktedonosporobacter sp.]
MATTWFEDYIQANGIRIHYHRAHATDKPSILLLHGVMDSGLCWPRVAHDLAGNYDVIMTDARGHGCSDGIENGFSLEALAADAAGVIRELGLQKPYLWGHSMGAITAAALATHYPDLARAIVLEDPPFFQAIPARANPEQESLEAEMWQALLAIGALSPEERLVRARAMNPNWPDEENIPWADSKAEFNPAVLLNASFFMKPWREALLRVDLPALLVIGDPAQHSIVTPAVAQEVAQTWKDCEVVQISGAGHNIHRDRYAETMQSVLDFLNRH